VAHIEYDKEFMPQTVSATQTQCVCNVNHWHS